MNPEYKPVSIFGHLFKIDGQQVYYHAGRDEYAIERDFRVLVGATTSQKRVLDATLAWEKAWLDAADALDDLGKEAGR